MLNNTLHLGLQVSVLCPELLDGGLVLGGSSKGVLQIVDCIARFVRLLDKREQLVGEMNK